MIVVVDAGCPNVDVEHPATDNNPGSSQCVGQRWILYGYDPQGTETASVTHECASVSSDSDESGHQSRMRGGWSSKNHLISQYNLEPQIPMDIEETNVDDG
ncbi:hypothetical protein QAD02_021850 [Eretmocerus hayati]|uniref:Uncharacterized protein n=1 Tax=Eretmocerus hayati TaxID=131215 RepID=A0ACC2PRN6_9HYME|nr:hypothetical protein QAD02_021850 [Eretmocerus hayati]